MFYSCVCNLIICCCWLLLGLAQLSSRGRDNGCSRGDRERDLQSERGEDGVGGYEAQRISRHRQGWPLERPHPAKGR